MEDIGEMILQLRRQVESIFSIKYGKLPVAGELLSSSAAGAGSYARAINFAGRL